jgi:Domain of unknown function (DUF4082)/PEP-CTERM motif
MGLFCFSTTRGMLAALALLGLAALPQAAQAQSPAVTGFTTGSLFLSFGGGVNGETIGWRFQAVSALSVSSLGYWDETPGTPLTSSHQVGLWTDSGTLLGNVTVQVNSGLVGSFRYEPLGSPITLTAGDFYRVGALDLSSDGDNYTSAVTSLTTDPSITFTGSTRNNTNEGFTFPGTHTPGGQGRFGPNLLIASASSAPEPGTLALFALGIAGGVVARRRK